MSSSLEITHVLFADNYKPDQPVFAVDGDTLAYRTAAVCEEHFEGSCREVLDKSVAEIVRATGIANFRVYLTHEINFRRYINNTYKANRNTMKRPQFLDYCREYLTKEYGALSREGYEADDLIATDMTRTGAFHCGVDKDLLQIPGRHYNYVKKEWIDVTPGQAALTLYRQVLMGDTSDNIKGLPKVGEAKAANFVTDAGNAFNEALNAYIDVCGKSLPDVDPFEYFIEQYNLVRMHKAVPIAFLNTRRITVPVSDLSNDFVDMDALEPVVNVSRYI